MTKIKKKNKLKTDVKLEVAQVTKSKGLFASRLKSKDVKIEDTTFVLQGLSSDVVSYCMAESTHYGKPDDNLMRFYFCQFGIKEIKGATDTETGKKVPYEKEDIELLGQEYEIIPISLLKMIDITNLQILYLEIAGLTFYDDQEEDKLDFTTPSDIEK